ncbi:Isoleucine--tRNA ligase [Candidatus Sulfotelmatobacter kueseliae]|uniref:Isoleucine--tRNA ligase n=1 Tax=Candidatus Sulfotelmatobacter kueseliae TaxID=2042962 RepID=A0A2U3L8Q8_9BACT|nr:Isoleucine--tRNA ligase [Candidatus Sulfotelmatobacter kueseliae]
MKANLPQNEPKMLERWEQMGIYERIRQARKGAGRYILHDGPPYTSGPIHLGTGFNKCLKDFIVKSKTMAGFDAPYVPGWDCHGLPIEIKVDKELGGKKLQMRPIDVRAECRKYAQKYLDLQRTQFKRIGVFGRFDRPYATMTPQYESVVLATFYSFYENGFVYKGLRAVYWCMHDETALAEAEVEYENHISDTVWVKYGLADDPARIDPALAGKKVSTIIWTTTPWTLPASMAVAFHPDEEYVALDMGNLGVFLVAGKLARETMNRCFRHDPNGPPPIIARFPGRRLERLNFQHPFLDRKVLGVLADYVTMDTGTGVVHTAPSHGAEDFATGVKYGLDATSHVDEKGILRDGLPEYDGKRVWDANQPIIELLRTRGALLHTEKTEHSYPHCWRCHNPVIFRATEQWFISMETPMPGGTGGRGPGNDTLRTRTLEEITKVKWDPAWGEERLANMIQTRPDWCISRQRVWGVPIAVFLCQACGQPLNEPAINQKVVELFAKSGADAWFTPESDNILPAGTKCPHCGSTKFEKETDIFDVWLESGASYLALVNAEPDYPWPSDLYLEGGDQYRGWFQSSLLCAMGTRATPPYRNVVTPGWTLDEKGQAMSKSRGNDVDPVDISNRLGGEIVRLWAASVDFREDVVGSETLMQRVAENYRSIRNNLFKNALGNLYDFDPSVHALPFEKLERLDQYMLTQTLAVVQDARKSYEEFAFHRIYHRVNHFCVVDLSAFYFDVIKDRLYTYAPNSAGRRSAQTAVWRICEAMARLLAPILSFSCEEVWQHLPKMPSREQSVHLAKFPEAGNVLGTASVSAEDPQRAQDWTTLLAVREQAMKALEEERNSKRIGKSLEAQLIITAAEPAYSVLERYAEELRYLFIVSAVTLAPGSGNGTGGVRVEVKKADGAKCERCWNYSTHVGEDKMYPTVCERCSAVLKELEG